MDIWNSDFVLNTNHIQKWAVKSQNNLLAVCESPNIPVYLPIPMYGLVVYQGRQIFPRIWNLKMLVHYICYDF